MPRAAVLARTTFVFATAATTGFCSTTAFAGPVPVGAFDVIPDGDHSTTSPALVGDLLAEKRVNFAIDDWATGKTLLAGTVDQRVIMEAETQSLTFHYLITNTPGPEGTGELFRASAFSFGEFVQTDVGYLVDDAAAGSPTRVGRTDNALDAQFDGAEGVLAEGSAISFFVHTNATTFDESGFVALDALAPEPDPFSGSRIRTGVADGMYRAIVFEGPVVVPLPAAVWTGIIGLGTVAWAKRRMRRHG
jgi:hypothetical protein